MTPSPPTARPLAPAWPSEDEARQAIVAIGRRLYDKGLIAAGDGNLSIRLGPDTVLVTATGTHKGFLTPGDLVVVDVHGTARPGSSQRPSSEFAMHALCYAERADCGAVVHAHPPHAVGLTLAGVDLGLPVLSESSLILGDVPVAPYATPGTEEVPAALRAGVRSAFAIMMDRHGALCLGRTLDEAWRRMETLEHTARTLAVARAHGKVTALGSAELDKLDAVAAKVGLPPVPRRR